MFNFVTIFLLIFVLNGCSLLGKDHDFPTYRPEKIENSSFNEIDIKYSIKMKHQSIEKIMISSSLEKEKAIIQFTIVPKLNSSIFLSSSTVTYKSCNNSITGYTDFSKLHDSQGINIPTSEKITGNLVTNNYMKTPFLNHYTYYSEINSPSDCLYLIFPKIIVNGKELNIGKAKFNLVVLKLHSGGGGT